MSSEIGTPVIDPKTATKKALSLARDLRIFVRLVLEDNLGRELTTAELVAVTESLFGRDFGKLLAKAKPEKEDMKLAKMLGVNGEEKRLFYAKFIKVSRILYMTRGDVELEVFETAEKEDAHAPLSTHRLVGV